MGLFPHPVVLMFSDAVEYLRRDAKCQQLRHLHNWLRWYHRKALHHGEQTSTGAGLGRPYLAETLLSVPFASEQRRMKVWSPSVTTTYIPSAFSCNRSSLLRWATNFSWTLARRPTVLPRRSSVYCEKPTTNNSLSPWPPALVIEFTLWFELKNTASYDYTRIVDKKYIYTRKNEEIYHF